MAVGEPKVVGTGVGAGPELRMLRDPNSGALLLEAGHGRLKLPGCNNEIRVHQGGLWYFIGDRPIGELGLGKVEGTYIPDGEKHQQPVCWDSTAERWVPTSVLKCHELKAQVVETAAVHLEDMTLDGDGITFEEDKQSVAWSTLRNLIGWDKDKPHGLPLHVDHTEGQRLICEVPLEAPNLEQFASKGDISKLHDRMARLTPEVTVPKTGSIAFDVDPNTNSLAVTVRKGSRTYRGTVELQEI